MKLLSNIVSWLFLPLFIPVYAILIAMYVPAQLDFSSSHSMYSIYSENKKIFLQFFILYAAVAPGISILVLRLSKIIGTIEMDDKRDRIIPLLLVACYSGILIFLLTGLKEQTVVSAHFLALGYAGLAMSLSFVIINFKTKISLHAGGVGMLLGFVIAYYLDQSVYSNWPIYIVLVIVGLVLMARIYLQKHTPFQAYFGLVLGSLITFSADYLCCHIWI